MFEQYNDILCIEAGWLYGDGGIMSIHNYKKLIRKGFLNKTRRACKGTPALVEYESIPQRFRKIIEEKYGNPKKTLKQFSFTEQMEVDFEARSYFSKYTLEDGRFLPIERQKQYICEAEILNTCQMIIQKSAKRKALGGSKANVWNKLSEVINNLDTAQYPHKLPTNPRRLRGDKNTRSYNRYIKQGFKGLIHNGYNNDNSRKVTAKIESMIISLYCLPTKPDITYVSTLFFQFLGEMIDVVDVKTGEVFDRTDFMDKGKPVEISEATIWNYLRDPRNELVIKKYRNGDYDFNHKQRPHVNRTPPVYSMSKISLDDRDIMHTKLPNGRRVMAYYAFDTMSTALIGYSHSKHKTHQLYLDCLKNMLRFSHNKGIGRPAQLEVEHHLVRDFKDGLMKAGIVFPLIRWCNPTNSQEKRAERLIGAKKYGTEKRNNQNVGRHYSRRDSNRVINQKIFDSENDNYKEATASYEVIVANDIQEIEEYNNELHPNQKKFPGMSRMDVLLYNVNPNLPADNPALIARYLGDKTKTSIRRSQYVQVSGDKYQLESPKLLSKLKPNNYQVEAYYLPNEANEIETVFLYQGDDYVGECAPVPTFNEANFEWTDEDKEGYTEAMKYVSSFDNMVKQDTEETLHQVKIMKVTEFDKDIEVITIEEEIEEEEDGFDELASDFSPEAMKRKAFNNL